MYTPFAKFLISYYKQHLSLFLFYKINYSAHYLSFYGEMVDEGVAGKS